jgi:hypothetical protein
LLKQTAAAPVHPTPTPGRIIQRLNSRPGSAMHKRTLQFLFAFILVTLAGYTTWASTRQSMFAWGGLTTAPDNLWTIATLVDAYYGFITFYLWVLWKETRVLPRALWFVAIMALGNIAMSAYVLRQLARLTESDSMDTLLAARNT